MDMYRSWSWVQGELSLGSDYISSIRGFKATISDLNTTKKAMKYPRTIDI